MKNIIKIVFGLLILFFLSFSFVLADEDIYEKSERELENKLDLYKAELERSKKNTEEELIRENREKRELQQQKEKRVQDIELKILEVEAEIELSEQEEQGLFDDKKILSEIIKELEKIDGFEKIKKIKVDKKSEKVFKIEVEKKGLLFGIFNINFDNEFIIYMETGESKINEPWYIFLIF